MPTGGSSNKLSKNVLQMKFMQRSVLRIEKEQNEEERQRVIDDEHWVLDIPVTHQKESRFVIESSLPKIQNLRFSRMSFKGFNPEVEKLMKLHDTERDLEEAERKEKEISVGDVEMADRYQNLIGTISKKFAKKRFDKPASDLGSEEKEISEKKAKREFLKPDENW
ncbi:hypothetical protein ScPMuIL_001808 [Solemya velum]